METAGSAREARAEIMSFPTFYVISPSGRVAYAANVEEPTATLMQELQQAAAGG